MKKILRNVCLFIGISLAPFSLADVVTETDIAYRTVEGVTLSGDIYRHDVDATDAGIVLIHGGGWRRGNRDQMKSIARQLARDGFVVFNVSYRLAPDHPFPAAVHDVKEAVRWLRANAETYAVDPERISAFGYSAGAHLALMLAFTDPQHGLEGDSAYPEVSSRVQAAVGGGSPTDLALFNDNPSTTDFLGGTRTEKPELYRQASPIHYVTEDAPPVFLYHGRSDYIVDIEHARIMRDALSTAGTPVELLEGRFGHIYRFLFGGRDVRAASAFLQTHLAAP